MEQQSVLYARAKGEINFVVTQNEIKVFWRILIVFGLCPVSCRRLNWKNDSVCQNTAVCNAMSRNRFDKIMPHIHFADNSVLNNADKYAKIWLFAARLAKRFEEIFNQRKTCFTIRR